MDQVEILELIICMREGRIQTDDFARLKSVISRRVRIRGHAREDVVMITIEKICFSRVLPAPHEVNLFIRQRITNAYYKAGIADKSAAHVAKQHKVKTMAVSSEALEMVATDSWTAFSDAETRADQFLSFSKKSNQIENHYKNLPEGDLFPFALI